MGKIRPDGMPFLFLIAALLVAGCEVTFERKSTPPAAKDEDEASGEVKAVPGSDPRSVEVMGQIVGDWVLSECTGLDDADGGDEPAACGDDPWFGLKLEDGAEGRVLLRVAGGALIHTGGWTVTGDGRWLTFTGRGAPPILEILKVEPNRLVLSHPDLEVRLEVIRLATEDLERRLPGSWRLAEQHTAILKMGSELAELRQTIRKYRPDPILALGTDGEFHLESRLGDYLPTQGTWKLTQDARLVLDGEAVTRSWYKDGPKTNRTKKRPVDNMLVRVEEDALVLAHRGGGHMRAWLLLRESRTRLETFLPRTWITELSGVDSELIRKEKVDKFKARDLLTARIPPLSGVLVLEAGGRYRWSRAPWLPRTEPHIERGRWHVSPDLRSIVFEHGNQKTIRKLDGQVGDRQFNFSFSHDGETRYIVSAKDLKTSKRGVTESLRPRSVPRGAKQDLAREQRASLDDFLGEGGVCKPREFGSKTAFNGDVEADLQRFRDRMMFRVALANPPLGKSSGTDGYKVKLLIYGGRNQQAASKSRRPVVRLSTVERQGQLKVFFDRMAACRSGATHLAFEVRGRSELKSVLGSRRLVIPTDEGVCTGRSDEALRNGSQDFKLWQDEIARMMERKVTKKKKNKTRKKRKKVRRRRQ